MIRLVDASLEYAEDAMKFLEEVRQVDGGRPWEYAGMSSLESATSYKEWVDKVQNIKSGKDLPEGYVRAATYLAVNEDNKIIGFINIRYELNEFLYNYGGHIGYSIRPSERKKGLGTQMLQLALDDCKKNNIDRVLITCHEGNSGSERLIIKCGGKYENTVNKKDEVLKRYWIEIKEK